MQYEIDVNENVSHAIKKRVMLLAVFRIYMARLLANIIVYVFENYRYYQISYAAIRRLVYSIRLLLLTLQIILKLSTFQ